MDGPGGEIVLPRPGVDIRMKLRQRSVDRPTFDGAVSSRRRASGHRGCLDPVRMSQHSGTCFGRRVAGQTDATVPRDSGTTSSSVVDPFPAMLDTGRALFVCQRLVC